MACVMSQKLLRERHRTAKHLRKYYLKCLDQLLHADFDRLVAVNFECLMINICIVSSLMLFMHLNGSLYDEDSFERSCSSLLHCRHISTCYLNAGRCIDWTVGRIA